LQDPEYFFLLLSYYLPGMWRGKKEELKTTEAPEN